MDILAEVKKRLLITDSYHDDMLNGLISDTKAYMLSAGISDTDAVECVGLIARGVADMYNMGSGDGKFSDIFKERCIQLCL